MILIVCLFAISAVSAEEIGNNTNILVSGDDSGLMAESVNEDLLTDSYGTFKELQNEIDAVGEGGTLNLTRSYKYVSGSTDGISIKKPININGQGHTLDGNKLSRIFKVNANNVFLKNINFVNGKSDYSGGAVYWDGANGVLGNCSFVNCYSSSDEDIETSGGAIHWLGNAGVLYNCTFVNSSSSKGGSVAWDGSLGVLYNCTFVNSKSLSYYHDVLGGAVYWEGYAGSLYNCNFLNSTLSARSNCIGRSIAWYGAHGVLYNCNFSDPSQTTWVGDRVVYWSGSAGSLYNCSFVNSPRCVYWNSIDGALSNSTFTNSLSNIGSGGAVEWNGINGVLSNCTFTNSSSYDGGAIAWFADKGTIYNCAFVNSSASNSGGAVYWYGIFGVLNNCTFKNSYVWSSANAICWNGLKGKINNSYFSPSLNTIYNSTYLQIIKRDSSLFCDNISFEYPNKINFSAYLNHEGEVFFYMLNEEGIEKTFIVNTHNGIATLFEELSELCAGSWNVSVIFKGDDNYYSCDTTAKIIIYQSNSSLTINNANATLGHESILVANVNSTLPVNDGVVTFYEDKNQIGESKVTDGKATITYTPTTTGEHTITAIFNSDNYLSSNDAAKLLVDSATVDVLVNSSTVGFESTFIANVKGLYSIINEGNVKFYVDNEYLGKVPIVNGSASINYVPLIAGDYTVNVIYCDSDKFLDDEDSTSYHVSKADTKTIMNDLKGTVGHDITITSIVTSSNKLTIGEGYVTFFDGKNQIGESKVTDGKATITYTPTTAGEHTITAIFNSDNYLSSNDTSVLSVKKANIDLTIADIAPVLFTNPSNFAVNVNSIYKAVNEGKIKYYVNNDLVGTVNVNDGVANLDYVTNTAGSFTLVAVYDETSNYLASNATATFIVNKMPTVLSAESVIFDEKGDKTFTTDLKDDNSIGVSGQNVKIETIKYSGESKTFNGITNIDGIAEYNVKNLEGGMWFVTGTYDGNGNYINSKFSDKFIVIRMDTTTNITGIDDSPKVNHTYKLKANIHDENGKLVKEGIVKFYLGGVDIGSIDLSKNKLSKNDELLGISNLIFDYKLGDDESDLYLEYTPTKAGTYTLSAVYEGTTIYRTSNETTTLIVKEEDSFILSAPDVTKYYGGSERFTVTLKDKSNNPIANASIKITINGRPSNRTTDDNGIASMGINLNSGVYITTTEYNGTKVNSTVTVKDTVIAKDFSKIFRNGTQYQGTFVDSQGNLIRNTDIEININGVFYTRKTNDNGVAQMNINLPPGTYILTATNPLSKEQHTTKVTVLPIIVENHDLTKYYKNASQYSLRLLDDKGNPVGAGVSIQLNINGVFYTRTSDANGYVKMNINLPPGTYIITAEYKGLRASNTIKVLSVLETKDLVMKYKDGSKFEAKILDGQGKPYAGQTVTFNINGVFYTKTTEADGIARLKINLLAGEYIITSMYNGLNAANKVTISA